MNPQELELARKIMSDLRNTTGYGYETLVRGTVISGLLDVAVIGCTVLSAIVAARFVYNKTVEGNKVTRYESDRFPPWGAAIIAFVVCGLVALVVFVLMESAVMSIFAPEYTVINKIIEKAAVQ